MFKQRIEAFVKTLQGKGCLLEETTDLYYFTGLRLSSGVLAASEKGRALFVDGRYYEKAKQQKLFEVLPKESKEIEKYFKRQGIASVVFDSAKTSVAIWQERQKECPDLQWIPQTNATQKLRAIKDMEEQKKLRSSAHLSKKAFLFAFEGLKEGVSEREIAWRFEKYCREHGADKMAFDPIVAFGKNSAFPHHRASEACLAAGETVLIDAGCFLDGYASDMTRTLAGSSAEMERLHRVVAKAQAAALKKCRVGIPIRELDLAAREEMRKEGLEEFFVHSLGHGIGLETHEYPRLSSKIADAEVLLEEGMAVTIEPGLYLPGIGGVRREDTVLITKDGIENFYGDLL